MTIGNIRKNIKKKVRALTDSLHGRGRPSPSPSVSATETARWPDMPCGSVRNMGENVALVSPMNQCSNKTSVPTPTTRVSLSSVAASADAVSLTEGNIFPTLVCTPTPLRSLTMLMTYLAGRTRLSHRKQMLPKNRRHRCGKGRSISFLTVIRKAFPSPMTTGTIIWKRFWRGRWRAEMSAGRKDSSSSLGKRRLLSAIWQIRSCHGSKSSNKLEILLCNMIQATLHFRGPGYGSFYRHAYPLSNTNLAALTAV
jgi:hypothetical protein